MEDKKPYSITYTITPQALSGDFVYLNPISLTNLYKPQQNPTLEWAENIIEQYLEKGDFTEANEILKNFK